MWRWKTYTVKWGNIYIKEALHKRKKVKGQIAVELAVAMLHAPLDGWKLWNTQSNPTSEEFGSRHRQSTSADIDPISCAQIAISQPWSGLDPTCISSAAGRVKWDFASFIIYRKLCDNTVYVLKVDWSEHVRDTSVKRRHIVCIHVCVH